ncbi:GNAT family N-acetyltransferase [Kribbella steppae]|uniref:GNAT family N-acetyltransferase n=1 Tax=Kribbella steppae TaxID=2512223 RepID=UPI0034E2F5AF
MLSFEVTVPGDRSLPMGGVTGTGVIATHRRRGLLRRVRGHEPGRLPCHVGAAPRLRSHSDHHRPRSPARANR